MTHRGISRRLALSGLAASAALAANNPAWSLSPVQTRTFVLVPGAWCGSWIYQRVARLLRARGHEVHALTLTGLADRSHLMSPQIRLQTHVDDVVNFLRWEELQDVVLVGHSYGGIVITGAAETLRSRLRAIAYLDAFIPGPGQALVDLAGPASRQRIEASGAASGGLHTPPIPARVFNVNESDRRWVDEKCTPQPLATFLDSLPHAEAYKQVPRRLYVRATGYASPPFDALARSLRGEAGWSVAELPVGHNLMIDAPAEVAALLQQVAS